MIWNGIYQQQNSKIVASENAEWQATFENHKSHNNVKVLNVTIMLNSYRVKEEKPLKVLKFLAEQDIPLLIKKKKKGNQLNLV